MSKVIYIDFDPQSFQLNPDNVLRINKWEGDMNDRALIDLAELLKTIHLSDADDVRPILQYYSQFDDPPAEFRRRAKLVHSSTNDPNVVGVVDVLSNEAENSDGSKFKSWFGTRTNREVFNRKIL